MLIVRENQKTQLILYQYTILRWKIVQPSWLYVKIKTNMVFLKNMLINKTIQYPNFL